MLEPTAFFEPYRAVLQVLQDLTCETFPIMNYIVGWEKEKLPPLYLVKTTSRNAKGTSSTIRNLEYGERNREDFASLPDALTQDLDNSQQEALHEALTSRVALVQGPPGTGKTFLALRILRSLLNIQEFWQGQNGDTEELLEELRRTYECNWNSKNEVFWNKYGQIWNDTRTPIVVICFTVRYSIKSY